MILKECEIFLSYLEAGEKSHWKLMRYQNLKIADDPHKYEILSLCLNNLIHVLTIARLTDEVNCKWGEPDNYLVSIISFICAVVPNRSSCSKKSILLTYK